MHLQDTYFILLKPGKIIVKTPVHLLRDMVKDVQESVAVTTEEKSSGNNYIDVVNKRLRTLRKRLVKIQKYEQQSQGKESGSLNEDQIKAIEKKSEVETLIKELEDLIKNFNAIEMEEQRQAKKNKRQQVLLEKQLAQEVTLQMEQSQAKAIRDIVRSLNVFTSIQMPSMALMLSNEDIALLHLFQNIVPLPSILKGEISYENAIEQGVETLLKFIGASEDTFGNFTYQSLLDYAFRIESTRLNPIVKENVHSDEENPEDAKENEIIEESVNVPVEEIEKLSINENKEENVEISKEEVGETKVEEAEAVKTDEKAEDDGFQRSKRFYNRNNRGRGNYHRDGERRYKREYNNDGRKDYHGQRREYNVERSEKRNYNNDNKEFNSDRRREYHGERKEYHGERREYHGERREYHGERREYRRDYRRPREQNTQVEKANENVCLCLCSFLEKLSFVDV
ncbi:hypothetical protein ROZALSC1DRAFT_27660 [Rozella allomycis CSF55]|uniref:Caprin-1 dimerization domain-containing protein n=1 Tax=Rozella allomycis (strain CSF55) TaxID=988480 RepID=A0A4P9YNQ0_ROZAC|nr:hypothetical protein ROZALSC1DRAFT_27660 [Rozella allomycis CSF55]